VGIFLNKKELCPRTLWEKVSGDRKGIATSDVIRSMKRVGFPDGEIYDVLTGAGLPGEQIQLLIDRVSAELYDAKLESKSSHLETKMREILRSELDGGSQAILSKLEQLSLEIQFMRNEVEKLKNSVMKLLEHCSLKLKSKQQHHQGKSEKY
jgi:DNA-binding transcriptional MerR regulator